VALRRELKKDSDPVVDRRVSKEEVSCIFN